MLKGHVFKRQVFGNQIFALFIDTFLNGKCGISNRYGEKMQVTYNGSTLYVNSGCVCIKGRFLEEDTSTEIVAGTESAFCKLVIEIDLDKENTDENLLQATYKVIKSNSNYPALTQTDIVANNSGVYQFELAQFKTSTNGITDFVDKRSYLDFESIYAEIEKHIQEIDNGVAYLLKTGGTITGKLIANGGIEGNVKGNLDGNAKTATTASSCTGNANTATTANSAGTCTR